MQNNQNCLPIIPTIFRVRFSCAETIILIVTKEDDECEEEVEKKKTKTKIIK